MKKSELFANIRKKSSYLCVGLDTDIRKIPAFLKKEKDPVFSFNQQIIDATIKYTVAYKPNLAFYEALGPAGLESLAKTMEYLPPDVFTIADAKRGDIGNTSDLYARTFFEQYHFHAVTVAPYMGIDSVTPFLKYTEKWVILLALTSNIGSDDFQNQRLESGDLLYETVLKKSKTWANDEQMMYVVGATKAEMLSQIRTLVPKHFLLVPGVGAQGGSLEAVSKNGLNEQCGLLINSSRGIIYASNNQSFAQDAGKAAAALQHEMKQYLDRYL